MFTGFEMSPRRRADPLPPAAGSALASMAVEAGRQLRDERRRRGWTLRVASDRAGIAVGVVHAIEAGRVASLESYARLANALGLRPELLLASRGRRVRPGPEVREAEDLVHASMGEAEARALSRVGWTVAIDEPYQHYQFAGRADLLAWDRENLLHIENRTRFPNIQEAAGAFNAKRRYLGPALAERLDLGPRGWRSVTHVMACLWSAEVLHVLRLRRATFAAICPNPPDPLLAWLQGDVPDAMTTSTIVVLDPAVPFGSRRRSIAWAHEPPRLEPRHRGYADAARALRRTR
jgi:transcriptional regulator with XRE-family HTH domain